MTSAPWSARTRSAIGPETRRSDVDDADSVERSQARWPSLGSASLRETCVATRLPSPVSCRCAILLRPPRSIPARLALRLLRGPTDLDERADGVLRLHGVRLCAVGLPDEARRRRRRGLVRDPLPRLGRQADRAAALGDLRRRLVRLPAHEALDVAVGRRLRRPGRARHAALELLYVGGFGGVLLGLVSFVPFARSPMRSGRPTPCSARRVRRCASATATGRW